MAISRAVTDCVEVDARSNCFIFFFLLLAKANGTNLSAPDEQADRQTAREADSSVGGGGVVAKDEIKLLLSCQLFA